MTITEAYQEGIKQLESSESTSPVLDSEVLLRFVLGLTKENFVANRKMVITPEKYEKFQAALKEREKGFPVAYLTGTKEFFGFPFKVNKHVLIPRPETESLVEKIQFELKGKHNFKILDIGTGSGCIIVSLAKLLSNNNQYFASDDSQRALALAEENALAHHVKVKFIRSDLTRTTGTDYDVIVANLPYLPEITDPSIRFEPKQALFAKKKGLDLYERLFKEIAASKFKPVLYLEFGHDQSPLIQALVNENLPDARMEIFKDMSGIPRFARIWQKTSL